MQFYKVPEETMIGALVIRVGLSLGFGAFAWISWSHADFWGLLGWLFIIACTWFELFTRPWKIRCLESSLEFHSPLRITKIAVPNLISINRGWDDLIRVRHTQSPFPTTLFSKLNGLNELLDRIKALNPKVKIKGFYGYSKNED